MVYCKVKIEISYVVFPNAFGSVDDPLFQEMLPFLGYLKFEVLQDSVFGFYLIPNCTHY
jgi:hypothetical protein